MDWNGNAELHRMHDSVMLYKNEYKYCARSWRRTRNKVRKGNERLLHSYYSHRKKKREEANEVVKKDQTSIKNKYTKIEGRKKDIMMEKGTYMLLH